MNKTIALLLGLLVAGCMTGKAAVEPPPDVVPVFYATDRLATGEATPQAMFGAERGPLSFGVVEVSVPRDHRTGAIESPSLWNVDLSADPARHVVDKTATPTSWVAFLGALQARIAESPDHSAFVFVHGYNVGFADAARRVAQVAYDLNWEGAAILFSWPSRGGLGSYWSDADDAEWAAADLAEVLTEVATRSGAETLHVIAHSMGTEPTLAALARLSDRRRPDGRPLFDEVVLAAPDVEAQAFAENLLQARPVAERWTVYVSSRDEALRLSSSLHDQPRAGYSADGVVVVPGVDTIDASAVDVSLIGHSYYGENRSVLADIFNLLKTRLPPEKRFGLRQVAEGERRYWVFQP